MGSVRYIGSKARLTADLMAFAGPPSGRFLDLFCGTGAVSAAAADAGWAVVANDNLNCAVTLTGAQLVAKTEARFDALGGYSRAIEQLEDDFVVEIHEIMEIGRYRPNVAASKSGDSVIEFIVEARQPGVDVDTEPPQVPKQEELPL